MTTTSSTSSNTPTTTSAPARPSALTGQTRGANPAAMIASYVRFELARQLRQFSSLFFMIGLPVMMYLIFGAMQDYSTLELPNGRGNVSGAIMISFAAYGAVTATASQAGSAAIELHQGWGRQIGITPFRRGHFVIAKTIVAVVLAILPILVIFAVGALTSARLEAWVWVTCGLLVLIPATVYALYGLAMGTLFRSEAAVNAASGLIVVLLFASGFFAPLSGFLLDMSPYTPMWGVMQLVMWPLQEGTEYSSGSGTPMQYEMWQVLLNIAVWTCIYAVLAWIGSRRGTSRR